ncbi:MAG: hypothetical protein M3Q48_15350 [Actinomycetota bacterium]|nr:hypothetical protein [Actinomycetota bacterium]
MYQIDGREVLFEWLRRQGDPERRMAMLDWIVTFASNPLAGAQRVPGVRAPVFIAVVPLNPPVVVTFLHAEQFRTVRLIKITPLP